MHINPRITQGSRHFCCAAGMVAMGMGQQQMGDLRRVIAVAANIFQNLRDTHTGAGVDQRQFAPAIEQVDVAVIIIGMGTSLPELSISVGAAIRNRARMSVGNLVGSNIFDTLVPVGVAAAISGLRFDPGFLKLEVPLLFVLTLVAMIFFVRTRGIQKGEAITILAIYGGYVLTKFVSVF